MGNIQFHFRNFNNRDMRVGLNHAGCGGAPWADGRPNCWGQTIPYNPTGGHNSVYVPSDWVINFDEWLTVIVDGLKLVEDIGIVIADEGGDLSSVLSDIFKIEKAIVEATAEKLGFDLTTLAANAKKSFESTCNSIEVTPQQVMNLAEGMGYGSTNWAFMAGSTYVENIHNKGGWSIFENEMNNTSMRIANHAFIINGNLVQAIDDGVIEKLWTNGPPWPSV